MNTITGEEDQTRPIEAPPLELERRIGTVLDSRYRLIELVGQGGMGAVFRAEHVTIRRQVALKLIGPELAGQVDLRRRFEREAMAVGRIDHPNCVTVLDYGALPDGSLYLTMEFLAGKSLAALLAAEGRLPARRALHAIRHVVRGLAHAHRAGIIHRDIKPDNIVLVEHDGVPEFAKILDFGICRLVDGEPNAEGDVKLTQAGVAFGTPIYISPEQAVGEPAGPGADLYSATVVLYELLAGRPPFVSNDRMELLGMHVSKAPPTLAAVAPEVEWPVALQGVVSRGLAKRPTERFVDADDYLAQIEALLATTLPGDDSLMPAGSVPLTDLFGSSPLPLERRGDAPAASDPLGSDRYPLPAEPIGLPAATPSIRKRRGGWLVGGVVLAAAATAFLWLRQRERPAAVTEQVDSVAERAALSIQGGDPRTAIRELKRDEKAIAGDAAAQLQLGHAHAARSEYRSAVEAYGRALSLEPGLAADATLQTNLRLMFDDDGDILVEAARLLAVHAGDGDAVLRVVALGSHKSLAVRRDAARAAESLGVADRIDRYTAALLDLEQARTCRLRRDAVGRLRAAGDPRAIPALEKAMKKRRPRREDNACLRRAAKDAIRYLENSAKTASKPTPG